MKKRFLLLMLFVALLAPWAVKGQNTHLVCDGTQTNSAVPIRNGSGSQTEFVYPASMLTAMDGGTITSVKFFYSTTTASYSSTATVYVEEVSTTTVSSSAWCYNQNSATRVYQGTTLTLADSEMTITFSTPYVYNGGNLCFNIWYSGSAPSVTSYGVSTDDYTSGYDWAITPPVSRPFSRAKYLPKAEFTYTPSTSTCKKPTMLTPTEVTASTATLRWTEKGSANSWILQYGTDSEFGAGTYTEVTSDFNTEAAPTITKAVTALNDFTKYYVRVKSVCTPGTDESDWSNTINFTTKQNPVVVGDSWSDNFEGTKCGWQLINGSLTNSNWAWGTAVNNGGTHAIYVSDDNGISNHFNNSGYAKVFAAKLFTFADNKYIFSYDWKCNGESTDFLRVALVPATETLTAGTDYSTISSTTLPTGWVALDGGSSLRGKTTWQTIPEQTKQVPAGNYYVVLAWRQDYSGGSQPPAAVDNFSITRVACDYNVADLAHDPESVTGHEASISWTNGDPGSWQVAWSKDYTFAAANTQTEIVNTNTINLVNLDASSTYYVKARAYCGGEDYGSWCDADHFDTDCEVVSSFPWSETFEGRPANTSTSYSETYKFNDPCWLNEQLESTTTGSGTVTWFQVCSYEQGGNSTNKLQLPDMKKGALTELRLPEMTLPNNNYQFTLDMYRVSAAETEGIRVFASTDGEIAGATELAFISRNYSTGDGHLIPGESKSGWYTYELPIGFSGTCYIILRGESQYSNASYMDNFVVETIPTCIRPKSPTSTAQTAHTATLSWTNGAEGQDAWQIAYSTSSTFAPADEFTPGEGESLADVTTNPATISGLATNTTYYAYVRANCGNSDLSKWSKTKATFTTKSGNAVPTGLAYDNESLTSSEVTINWNGVATNDLHASFELYISTESTTPGAAPEPSDNFITGITASTHHFNTLTAETQYYVWVRDNCGTDGLSNWSSSINFTTASNCQTPDGLTFSAITSSSFTVDWADHGTVSNWNVRYSSDGGESWTPIENATKPCPIGGLTQNTEYRVQVQATCNTEVWSTYATCRTVYGVPFTEEFSNTSIPTNWENKTGFMSDIMSGAAFSITSQWSFGTGSNNVFNSHTWINIYGGINESNARKGWLITPNITLGANYSLSFDMALTTYSSSVTPQPQPAQTTGEDDKFVVLVSTDNETTWTVVRQWDNAGSAYVYNDIPTAGETFYIDLAAYSNQTVRIAFYGESTIKNADNNLHIDNVEVNITNTCYKPTNVTASNVTNHSATVTWTPGTTEQTSWVLKYNKGADFNPITEGTQVSGDITTPSYTFNKSLDAESIYYVYVRGNCGGDEGPWSKKCVFSTEIAAPAPTTFAKTEVGPDWVDLYWNAPAGDYLSGYGIYYSTESATPATTAEALVTINNTAAPTSEAPYRLPELESEETYYIWVRANHEANVYSSWKAISGSYITTLTACPTPTNLAANNILHTSADLTWTGYSDSYTLNYYKYNPVFEYDFESATPWAVDEFDPCSTYDGDGNMSGAISGITFDNQNYTGAFIAFQNGIASNAFAHSGNAFGASFYSSDGNDDWFILPEITIESGYKLQFWARSFNDNYGLETFRVGVYGNTDGTFSSFLAGETESVEAPVEWTQFRYDLSAYEGQSIKLAINHDSGDVFAFFIDDIFVGTITEEGSITNVTSPYTITVLTADTKYDVRVKGNCEGGTYSDACTFTTIDDNIKIFKTEGYWNNTANWSGGIPTIANDVIIRANATIGSTCVAEANSITYEGSPAPTLTIADGGQLKHAENVNATLQKEITAWTTKDVGGWYFIASPVDGAAIDESFDQTIAKDLFKYDEPDAYWYSYLNNGQNLHPFSTLTRGVGYLHASESQQTLEFTGEMVSTNESISLPLSYACEYTDVKGYNLMGNPFTRNLTTGDITKGGVALTTYYGINAATTGMEAKLIANEPIKPGQGFFVQVESTDANHNLVFNPSKKDETVDNGYICIAAENENNMDKAYVQIQNGNTLRKMNIANMMEVYVMNDGDDYAAARVEELAGTMPVHFKAVEDGEFTITINAKNIEASTMMLFDNQTGELIDLLETPTYAFKASAEDDDNRFKLIFDFNNNYNGVDDNYVNGNFAYQNGDELLVSGDGTLQVFDVMGRFVMSKEIHGSESVCVSAFETGVYMLRFVGENIMTQKIVVR